MARPTDIEMDEAASRYVLGILSVFILVPLLSTLIYFVYRFEAWLPIQLPILINIIIAPILFTRWIGVTFAIVDVYLLMGLVLWLMKWN